MVVDMLGGVTQAGVRFPMFEALYQYAIKKNKNNSQYTCAYLTPGIPANVHGYSARLLAQKDVSSRWALIHNTNSLNHQTLKTCWTTLMMQAGAEN
jgi:hypothetical protein